MKSQIASNPPLKKSDGSWAKSNIERAELLADHFKEIFSNMNTRHQNFSFNNLHAVNEPLKSITSNEINVYIAHRVSSKKSPGYDLITVKLLAELPQDALIYIRNIFNAIFRLYYFP